MQTLTSTFCLLVYAALVFTQVDAGDIQSPCTSKAQATEANFDLFHLGLTIDTLASSLIVAVIMGLFSF